MALSEVLQAGAVGTEVYGITDKMSDAAGAAGYAAWVNSITGSMPLVQPLGDNRARVYLTETQAASMRAWMDERITEGVFPATKKQETLDIDFGSVTGPLVMKYALVLAGIFFLAGWTGRGMVRR